MADEKLKSYQEVIKELHQKKRTKHLLLGNGFSMSYDHDIFSYNALSKFIYELDDKNLHQLFEIVNTRNFELLMQQLDNAARIAVVFGASEKVVNKIKAASDSLKTSLIDAIKTLHPDHVFKIPEDKSQACASFLNEFLNDKGNIFTTNYDLLLYWVLLRNNLENKGDGFGRDAEESDDWIPEDERQFSELRWGKNKDSQTIHYLHGALQLFDTGIEIEKEEYTSDNWLMGNIKDRMEEKQYPIFVTAGSGKEKLIHIMHNKYLAYCYEAFSSIEGSLISFGFNFGQYDEHIIRAINKAHKWREVEEGKLERLQSIYIGVYSEDDLKHIKSIEKKFKLPVRLFDAKTVKVWG